MGPSFSAIFWPYTTPCVHFLKRFLWLEKSQILTDTLILRPAATCNMTPYSILCNLLLMCFLHIPYIPIPDCLGDHSIDRTQLRGWCVSITLRMQRAHHHLSGNTVSCWWAERRYAMNIRRRRPRGSSVTILLCSQAISVSADYW